MGFKINMAPLSAEEVKKIRDERPAGGYDGPTPPPGLYDAKVTKMWFAESKTGQPMLKVSFVLDNDDDKKVYNGASTIQNYMIPTDPTQNGFDAFVGRLDSLFLNLSGGKMGIMEFQDAVVGGRTNADHTKKDKIGIPVSQIGSLRITGEQKLTVKTKVREYNDKEYIEIHYIKDEPKKSAEAPADDLDLDLDGSDDDEASFDEWLES
jgi:hypothetical protein